MARVEMASSLIPSWTYTHKTELVDKTCPRGGGHCLSPCIGSWTSQFVSETELTGDGTVSVPLIYPLA